MRTDPIRSFALFLALSGIGVTACANKAGDCDFVNQCSSTANGGSSNAGAGGDSGGATNGGGSGNKGGTSGEGGAGTTQPTCDTSKSPSGEGCLIADKYAVFVSPEGDDADDGTQSAPVKTLAKALSLATTKKSVIACSGTYTESLSITARAKIYGSFDCSNDWKYNKTKPTVVAPTSAVPALNVAASASIVVIEDVQFKAADATTASGSSIAAFVKDSTNVTLRRVGLAAGNGAAAKTPAISPYTFADVATLVGNAGTADSGGIGSACMCPNGAQSRRGGGGALSANGGPGTPAYNATGGLGGDTTSSCSGGGIGSGGDGSTAPPSTNSVGAITFGTFANDTWTPASGVAGLDGQPGQGGGGGAGKSTGGGGSGACGGCGGKGGPAGNGGGASIALLSVNSTVSLEASTLVTGNGGAGSDGAVGQVGQIGGERGNGFASGCDGGNGGAGASGASGGGGAGGISVGILYSGTVPSTDTATKTTLGQPGIGGKGGDNATNTDDGIDGTAANALVIP